MRLLLIRLRGKSRSGFRLMNGVRDSFDGRNADVSDTAAVAHRKTGGCDSRPCSYRSQS